MRASISGFFEPRQIEIVTRAFHGACKELGIDRQGFDVVSRERLAAMVVHLAQQGELNVDALRRRAIIYFRNTTCGAAEGP